MLNAAKEGWESFCGFGVGIFVSDPAGPQFHVGMAYTDFSDGAIRFYHFANHFELKKSAATYNGFLWANSGLDEDNRELMLDWVNVAANIPNQQLPYGFDLGGEIFDKNGMLLPMGAGKGATCASFVIAAHRTQGLEMFGLPWPSRPDDAAWQEHIIGVVEAHCRYKGIDATTHIADLRSEINGIRYRPDEVAAGMISSNTPLAFEDARKMADDIVEQLLNA